MLKCSQVLFDEVERLGGQIFMSKTGHSHVKNNLKKFNADLAGEMSGHIFLQKIIMVLMMLFLLLLKF